MKIGSLIKFHRTKQGLTQQTLADGICSVPHLSKIENNSKEANEETIRLLLERLNIDLQDVEKLEGEIKLLLRRFVDEMYYLEMDQLEKTYNELITKDELIPFTDQLYLYELYKARYYLLIHKADKAEKQLKWLTVHKQNFSQLEKHLHTYISALALAIRGKVEDAEEQLSYLIENALMSPEMIGEINYNFSVLKSSLNQYGPSIYYGKNALQQFKEDFNFIRIVQVQMLLAVNYSRALMFNEALEIYQHLIRNTMLLNKKEYLPSIYHNMGDMYHMIDKYDMAGEYFSKAMELLPKTSELYLLSLHNKGISEMENKNYVKSKSSFELLNSVSRQIQNTHYQLFSQFYLIKVSGKIDEAMKYLETKILPYTNKKTELKESHKHFSQLLADYFKEKGQFDKALHLLD
ncbi:helix-turn-helix domain-containing protein [Chryseomicrobium palamuruense]|uniref:Helix-turn-helix domain-containing protein n=1 Tax=Chryseomicrobium palamuruense TaxID=682973 RepID=A0ABV8UV66_9BACL